MAIVDFIMSNYIAIAIVVIIIILGLIGRYVEKIGFFEQAPDKKNATQKNELPVEDLTQPLEAPSEPKKEVEATPVSTPATSNVSIEDIDSALFAPIEDNHEYDALNKEVKELLPKKDIIGDDLLSDIDNLSLDKTQKYNFGDIPDLDDVDLPDIKKSDEDEDIWKF